MKNIFLQSYTNKIIDNDIKNNMLNHSYMLVSTDKALINSFAQLVACKIMCNNELCGTCPTCVKITNHNHSDVMELPTGEKGILSVDADKIIDDSYVLPMEGDKKIYILHNFDECNNVVQNKLLKTIEEPSKSVVFIITCVNDNLVLPTIRSRCKKITERVLSDDLIANYLKDTYLLDNEIVKRITPIANGNLTVAIDYATNSKLLEMRDLCENIIKNMKYSGDVLRYSVQVQKYKNNIDDFLNVLLNVVHDNLISGIRLNLPLQLNEKTCVGISKVIEEGIKKHNSNCNVFSIIEGVLMGILEVKYKCQK